MDHEVETDQSIIVFFDGVCGLCNRVVDFLLRIDRRRILKFTPLQGITAAKLLPPEHLVVLNTILLIEAGTVSTKSNAILRIFRRLGGLWRFGLVFYLIPRILRDAIYDLVANNRYRIFGKKESCRIPTAEERPVFLP